MHFRHLAHFGLALIFSFAAGSAAALERVVVDHAYVTSAAEKLAKSAYQPADRAAPRYFRELNYDQYRKIQFKSEANLWHDSGLKFQLQFYHPGYLYGQMVQVNEFTDTHSQPIPFSRNFFDYHDLSVPMVSRWGLDFAGFRVLHPLNQPDRWDEVISFLGASYYRALGRQQVYGSSARGIAINSGGPAQEEFPAFTEFWIGKPNATEATITVHALLDGPSVTGAYTFIVSPGTETVVEVHATLFLRKQPETVGLIPLTSMFWFGEGTATRFGDFRPEVHDADGLLIADAQARVWRPLINPTTLTRTEYDVPAFGGFGLLQRDRSFRNYEDLEADYERRPGVWVEPVGTWPAGKVRLIEQPARDEYHDNVAVYWVPRDPLPVGQPIELKWRQRWTFAATFGGPPGWVASTRQTVHDGGPDRTRFILDFDPASLAKLPKDAPLQADIVTSPGAKVLHTQVVHKEIDGAQRLVFVVQAPPGGKPVDIRARLVQNSQPVTETWTMKWQP